MTDRVSARGRLSKGDRLGPYEIVGALGSGGMGEVFRARDSRLRRDVAIKVIHPSVVNSEYVERFNREARAAAALNHPNIVAVFDVSIDGPVPYVVSELLDGESLRSRLDRGPLPYRKAIDYGIHIAEALAAAHAKGIYHRDVKPGNVFITKDGRVKLLDFGLAKLQAPDLVVDSSDRTPLRLSRPGGIVGTPGYTAPEQVLGEPVDHRADIFALGAVLYEMLSNNPAFQRSSTPETLHAVLEEEPRDLLALDASLPPAAVVAVRRCLEKKPEERFQSARDLAFLLEQLEPVTSGTYPAPARLTRRLIVAAVVSILALGAGFAWMLSAPNRAPTFEQLTFHRGHIGGARFAGDAVVYSQTLGLNAPEVSLRLAGSPESRRLGYADADVLATRSGEVALLVHRRFVGGDRFVGTLAIAPLGGGAPHEVLEDVEDADYDISGNEFVVARSKGLVAGSHLEYPIGRTVYRTPGSLHSPRLSRDGELVAFLEDPAGLGTAGRIVVVERDGEVVLRTRDWSRARGLAWSPEGNEVWFTAAQGRVNRVLWEVDLEGNERLVHAAPGSLRIWDVASDGRVLLTRENERMAVVGVPPDATTERDLSWFDSAGLASLSPDGRLLLFGDRFGIYLRRTDGSPAAKLGSATGFPDDLAPDGRNVLATNISTDQLFLIPTGAGRPRSLKIEGIQSFSGAWWFPDGRRILFNGRKPNQNLRSYVVEVSGGRPRAVTEEGTWALSISPNGELLAAVTLDRGISLWPVDGGSSKAVPGSKPGDRPVAWSGDGEALWIFRRGEVPADVYRLDITTGKRELWKTLVPPDAAGVYSIDEFKITPSGHAYFYSYRQTVSELYEVRGLR